MKIINKKGISYTEIVFILLNLIVFSFLLVFISRASTNTLIYEQTYSKQIALAIDAGKPNMTVTMDFSEGIKLGEKNKVNIEEAFKINTEKKEVIVSLSKKGRYIFNYFSDYNVSLQVDGGKVNLLIK